MSEEMGNVGFSRDVKLPAEGPRGYMGDVVMHALSLALRKLKELGVDEVNGLIDDESETPPMVLSLSASRVGADISVALKLSV